MICLLCRQAEALEGSTIVTFERGEFRLIVNAVPARVCPSCGEAFVEEAVAEQLLHFVRQRSEEDIWESQYEFGTLQV